MREPCHAGGFGTLFNSRCLTATKSHSFPPSSPTSHTFHKVLPLKLKTFCLCPCQMTMRSSQERPLFWILSSTLLSSPFLYLLLFLQAIWGTEWVTTVWGKKRKNEVKESATKFHLVLSEFLKWPSLSSPPLLLTRLFSHPQPPECTSPCWLLSQKTIFISLTHNN